MRILDDRTFDFLKKATFFAERADIINKKGPWEHFENVLLYLNDIISRKSLLEDTQLSTKMLQIVDFFMQNNQGYSLIHQNRRFEQRLLTTPFINSFRKELPTNLLSFCLYYGMRPSIRVLVPSFSVLETLTKKMESESRSFVKHVRG